jgi:hypothetical protein
LLCFAHLADYAEQTEGCNHLMSRNRFSRIQPECEAASRAESQGPLYRREGEKVLLLSRSATKKEPVVCGSILSPQASIIAASSDQPGDSGPSSCDRQNKAAFNHQCIIQKLCATTT